MTGVVRSSRIVELDDDALTALSALGGRVWVDDADGYSTSGELAYVDGRYVVVCAAGVSGERVTVRPRGARAA